MVPLFPTAVPVLALVKETSWRSFVVPLDWLIQVLPPSVVRRIVPFHPTTVPVLASVKETPLRLFPCGSGFCQNQPSCAKVISKPTTKRESNIRVLMLNFLCFSRWAIAHNYCKNDFLSPTVRANICITAFLRSIDPSALSATSPCPLCYVFPIHRHKNPRHRISRVQRSIPPPRSLLCGVESLHVKVP